MFLKSTKKGSVLFFGIAMPGTTTRFLERLLDPELRKIRGAFAVGGFWLRLAARWGVARIAGRTGFRSLVVLWATNPKTIFQIQSSPTIEAVVFMSENSRPAADSKPGNTFEKIGSLLVGPFVFGMLAWLSLASGRLGSGRLVGRRSSTRQVGSIECRS